MKKTPRPKTKIGDRIRITSVPFGVSNLSVGIEGETIASPEIINDFVQVKVKLDDGRIVTWKESNLEIIEDVPSSKEVQKTEIDLIDRNGRLYAKVKDLRKHPLNNKIYDPHNIENLCTEIKASGWIEALVITPDGKTISGNSRLECCRRLNKEEVEVRVREFKDEIEETEAFLLANSYRVKTNEELIREGLLREEVEKKKAAIRQETGVKIQDLVPNSAQGSAKGRVRDIVAKQLRIGKQRYSQGKQVVNAIESLNSENKLGAAKQLKETLNNKSFNAAFNQVNDLKKVEGAIKSLKTSKQDKGAKILEQILEKHSIKDAIKQMNEWESEYKTKQKKSEFQHLDVVRILGNECRGQWAILDTIDEFQCTLMTATANLEFVPLTEIEKIELSEEEKQKAYDLMIRLQRSSYQLQGKNEPLAHQIIQYVAKKQSPALSILEEVYLLATEVFLIGAIEEIKKRSLEVLKFKSKE